MKRTIIILILEAACKIAKNSKTAKLIVMIRKVRLKKVIRVLISYKSSRVYLILAGKRNKFRRSPKIPYNPTTCITPMEVISYLGTRGIMKIVLMMAKCRMKILAIR